MNGFDLLSVDRGLVVAPAGCGKTHLITDALGGGRAAKPILVLTHTNAGVAALRHRLTRQRLISRSYRLATIDGWALKLASTFPERSGYRVGPNLRRLNYPGIRKAAWRLLKNGHLDDVLQANYSRILVDEYQDCSLNQHAIIYFAARHIPTCVLGDPMQAIFGFGDDGLADWENHVCEHFPLVAELSTPWRWKNVGNEELGLWLLRARESLLRGLSLDVERSPGSVRWVELKGDRNDHVKLVSAARCSHKARGETSLIIGDSRSAASRYRIAKNVPGIVTVEPVDLRDLTEYARELSLHDGSAVAKTLRFAETLITNVGADAVLARVNSLKTGTARRPATEFEKIALGVDAVPTLQGVARLLSGCSREYGCRVYRPGVLRAALRAMSMADSNPDLSFEERSIRIREENRAVGRQLPRSAIGSTLLLKGLEADHVVVLNADNLDKRNLYVAMSRGAKSITLCSRSSVLAPK